MKRFRKNMIGVVLSVIFIGNLSLSVFANVPAEEEPLEMAPALSETTAEDAYQEILARYQEVINTEKELYLNNPDAYFNGDHAAVFYYHTYQSDRFYYTYRDLDGNGIEELLIGFGNEGYIRIVDIYGFDGVQAVQLMDEPALGDRASLTLLQDGTMYFWGSVSAEESIETYFRVDGVHLVETSISAYEEVYDIIWQDIQSAPENTDGNVFHNILDDVIEVLGIPTSDYDADMEYYDTLYSHLGPGIPWILLHREVDIYTLCIWSTEFDIDQDGQTELCLGRGVSPSSVDTIAIYEATGEAIFGDMIYSYTMPYNNILPVTWNYIGG